MSAFRVALTRIGVAIVLAMLCAGNALAQGSELVRADALDQQVIQLYRQGRYGDAVVAQEALAIREKALGPEHADVAHSLNNLAKLYDNQGRYAEAEPLYQHCLAILEKALGPEHPNVATGLNNLGGLYYHQGRYAEAEPLFKRNLS